MKLNAHDIDEVAKELVYEESTEPLTGLLVHGDVCDFEFPTPAEVRVEYYRAGPELFFNGHIAGSVLGHCARCLEPYAFDLDTDFFFVLVPRAELADEMELHDEELDLSFYQGDEVDLTPLVREQIILALPSRPLCREDCRGLCPQCGANRNVQPCTCVEAGGDPRLAVFRHLKVGR